MAAYIPCRWIDDAFHPRGEMHLRRCREAFGDGRLVFVVAEHERDMTQHRRHFAVIRTAWMNLPEHLQGADFALNEETLRKYALVRTGYADLTTLLAQTKAAAIPLAAWAAQTARTAHGYAIVEVKGRVVRVWTPHSQSLKAMGEETFRRSAADCAAFCAELIGVTVEELKMMGRKEAA